MAVIRVTGQPGAGKSTQAQGAAEELGYGFHRIGKIFRYLASQEHLSIEEYYGHVVKPDLEMEIDALQEELMLKHDDLVVDGRMAPWLECGFQAVNVMFAVDQKEGARRLLRRPENVGRTLEEMMRLSAERVATEHGRYLALHGVRDHLDQRHFIIVIDTTFSSVEETLAKFLEELRKVGVP